MVNKKPTDLFSFLVQGCIKHRTGIILSEKNFASWAVYRYGYVFLVGTEKKSWRALHVVGKRQQKQEKLFRFLYLVCSL
jgi:hypothetical protein